MLEDVWLGDFIKCLADNDRATNAPTKEAFAHCSAYLEIEIKEVDPQVGLTKHTIIRQKNKKSVEQLFFLGGMENSYINMLLYNMIWQHKAQEQWNQV